MQEREIKIPHRRFTEQEDKLLIEAIAKYGSSNWNVIAKLVPNRNSRQCYERWANYLSPFIKRDEWTKEEDEILLKKSEEFNYKWTKVQAFLPGRTVSNLKSRHNKLMKASKTKYKYDKPVKDDSSKKKTKTNPKPKAKPQNKAPLPEPIIKAQEPTQTVEENTAFDFFNTQFDESDLFQLYSFCFN